MSNFINKTSGKSKFTASTTGENAVLLDGVSTCPIETGISFIIKSTKPSFFIVDETNNMDDSQDEDQSWFWTKEWQLEEIEADNDIASGNVIGPFDNIKDVLNALTNTEV